VLSPAPSWLSFAPIEEAVELLADALAKTPRLSERVTEIVKIPNRGHALTIDDGWRAVAQTALDFVKRFA